MNKTLGQVAFETYFNTRSWPPASPLVTKIWDKVAMAVVQSALNLPATEFAKFVGVQPPPEVSVATSEPSPKCEESKCNFCNTLSIHAANDLYGLCYDCSMVRR
jgi:hypothetical protein